MFSDRCLFIPASVSVQVGGAEPSWVLSHYFSCTADAKCFATLSIGIQPLSCFPLSILFLFCFFPRAIFFLSEHRTFPVFVHVCASCMFSLCLFKGFYSDSDLAHSLEEMHFQQQSVPFIQLSWEDSSWCSCQAESANSLQFLSCTMYSAFEMHVGHFNHFQLWCWHRLSPLLTKVSGETSMFLQGGKKIFELTFSDRDSLWGIVDLQGFYFAAPSSSRLRRGPRGLVLFSPAVSVPLSPLLKQIWPCR